MTTEDLGKLTRDELNNLSRKICKAIDEYDDRLKKIVYKIHVEFESPTYFIYEKNAIKELQDLIEEGEVFTHKITLSEHPLTDAEIEKYCVDFNK